MGVSVHIYKTNTVGRGQREREGKGGNAVMALLVLDKPTNRKTNNHTVITRKGKEEDGTTG